MQTRYISNIFITFAVVCVVMACNKQLDLKPEGTLTETEAIKDSANTAGILAGAYQGLFAAGKSDAYTIGDITTRIATSYSDAFVTGNMDSKNEGVASIWTNNYAAINLANVIITQVPLHATYSKELQQQYIAEAKFIRAFAYFNLLKLFGDGALQGKTDNLCVPLRLEAYNGYDSSKNIPRSSNGTVYAQIMKDIDEAATVLPEIYNNDLSTRALATKGSANALAARVSLYMHDYDKCLTYSDAVLNNGNYVLQNAITDVFKDNSSGSGAYPFNPEIIFAFPVSHNQDPTQYASHFIYYVYNFVKPNPDFLNTYNSDDMRRTAIFTADGVPFKFTDPFQKDNLVMIRLAEVLLTKAEALANTNGVDQNAVDLLNALHQRAFDADHKPALYTTNDFADAQQLIDRILQERRWELAFEGHDRFDKIRSGQKPNDVLPENRYALPIPQREIDITSGLIKQNPGY